MMFSQKATLSFLYDRYIFGEIKGERVVQLLLEMGYGELEAYAIYQAMHNSKEDERVDMCISVLEDEYDAN